MIDKATLRELFDCPEERHRTIQAREQKPIKNLESKEEIMYKPQQTLYSMTREKVVEESLRLKIGLPISPKDYRIHFFKPSTLYDAAYMQAFDGKHMRIEDDKVAGKSITMCLFPALLERNAAPIADDACVEDVLAKNKKLFPIRNEVEALDPKNCVAKASVLIV